MNVKAHADIYAEQWLQWQVEVVQLVRRELLELSHSVHGDDFDWEAWRLYFDEGYLPVDAVKQALSLNSYSGHSVIRDSAAYSTLHSMHMEVD